MTTAERVIERINALHAMWADEGAACGRRLHEWAMEPTSTPSAGRSQGTHADPTSSARPNHWRHLLGRWNVALTLLSVLTQSPGPAHATTDQQLRALRRRIDTRPTSEATLTLVLHIVDELEDVMWQAAPIPHDWAQALAAGRSVEAVTKPECFACLTPISGRTKSRLCADCRRWRHVLVSRDPDALNDDDFTRRVRSGITAGVIVRRHSPLSGAA